MLCFWSTVLCPTLQSRLWIAASWPYSPLPYPAVCYTTIVHVFVSCIVPQIRNFKVPTATRQMSWVILFISIATWRLLGILHSRFPCVLWKPPQQSFWNMRNKQTWWDDLGQTRIVTITPMIGNNVWWCVLHRRANQKRLSYKPASEPIFFTVNL